MIRILPDTCVLIDAIVWRKEPHTTYFFRLLNQHRANLIQVVVPKAVQAEFYGPP